MRPKPSRSVFSPALALALVARSFFAPPANAAPPTSSAASIEDLPPLPPPPPPPPPPPLPKPPPPFPPFPPFPPLPPPPPPPTTPRPRPTDTASSFGLARTLAGSVPTAATLEGSWSLSLHVLTQLVNRTWDAPYPWNWVGQYSARILYGTSWTLMLGLEGMLLLVTAGPELDGIAEASWRTDWVVSYDLPACPSPGAFGGCGVGVGGFSTVALRLARSKWWLEAGGGWVQQRVLNDENRTVGESIWVLSPLTATYALSSGPGPVELRARFGPGIYFGAHQAHVHPTLRGRRAGVDPPWTEMYPLDAGIGPGGRVELDLRLAEHVSLDAELVVAPFLLGGPTTRRDPEIAPLDFARDGISTWRRSTVALGWVGSKSFQMKTSFALSAMELSDRPITRAGHLSGMLRFDIPLDLARARRDR